MNIVGYAQASTRDQNRAVSDRPDWMACLDYLRPGGTLVVRALDRVAGSEVMAFELMRDLALRGIRLHSFTDPFFDVDTSTLMGEAIGGIMTVFAQLRVSTIRDNTRRVLERAQRQGRVAGRPSVMFDERTAAGARMRENGDGITKFGRTLGVGASSVARSHGMTANASKRRRTMVKPLRKL